MRLIVFQYYTFMDKKPAIAAMHGPPHPGPIWLFRPASVRTSKFTPSRLYIK